MLNFNYTLDNELRVEIGRVPTAINTQALEMAANKITRRFRETKRVLTRKVPGIGASAYAGMAPAWRVRIKAETAWVEALLDRIVEVGSQIVFDGAGDAFAQGTTRELWNRWAPEVLSVYSQTLRAYQKDVAMAMSNQTVSGMPFIYAKMANLLKEDPPDLSATGNENLAGFAQFTDDDAAYLADLDLNVLGREVPDGLIALSIAALAGGWWWLGRKRTPALGGYRR